MAVSLFDGFLKEVGERRRDGYQHRAMMGDVIVQKLGAGQGLADDFWAYSLDLADQRFIEAYLQESGAVTRRVRFLAIDGLVQAGGSQAVFVGYGFDLPEGLAMRGPRWAWNTLAGRPMEKAAEPSVVVGAGLGRLLQCESTYRGPDFFLPDGNYVAEERPFACASAPRLTFSATTEASEVNALTLPLAGIIDFGYREGDRRSAYMPLATAQKFLDTDKITLVSVALKADVEPDAFIKSFTAAAKQAGRRLEAIPWSEHTMASYEKGGMEMLGVIRNLFMTIVAVVAAMTVTNTMAKAVNERVRELGTLRCLGFRRRDLLTMIAWEGSFLSVIACGIGLILTLVAAYALGAARIRYRAGFLSVPIDLRITFAPSTWALSALVLILLATGTGWVAARRAVRLGIAESLRYLG